jgi:hypothetical protein
MIAIGVVLLFVFVSLALMYGGPDNMPEAVMKVAGVALLGGGALIVAGVVVFAWRYLP